MTRPIDADALITAVLKNAIDYAVVFGDSEMHRLLVQVIAHQPTIDIEPQWIPCSERLPEEKGEYLVTYHPCYWDNVWDDIKVGIDSFRGKTAWAKKKHQRVIAWMPLPKPYEVENEKTD